ncbi:MAG: helix-turn-helix transcriptional regulator [Chloroflexi bacterium]|nr:helix-turn-helix transcriptional regulator [Chloroflexota bacterium]
MQRVSFKTSECPIARGVDPVGDWWSVLILRDVFDGFTRFDELEQNLRITPAMLTRRLKSLVEDGLLERRQYSERPPRFEYVLTERGRTFRPLLLALYAIEYRETPAEARTLTLVEIETGRVVDPVMVDRATGRPIEELEVAFTAGPAASERARRRYQRADAARHRSAPPNRTSTPSRGRQATREETPS